MPKQYVAIRNEYYKKFRRLGVKHPMKRAKEVAAKIFISLHPERAKELHHK